MHKKPPVNYYELGLMIGSTVVLLVVFALMLNAAKAEKSQRQQEQIMLESSIP
jgi:hypothetical protein